MEKAHRALLLTDVVDSTRLVEALGLERAAELWVEHDALARELLHVWRGQEIDKTDGFLLIFESTGDAAAYAIDYHSELARMATERVLPIRARAGLHFGEVILRKNPSLDVERGAKPLEVEGVAKPTAARVMSVASGGQTLMTASALEALGETVLRIESHGHWRMKGLVDPVELFEVGDARSPWCPPTDGEKVHRVVADGEGWRPVRDIRNNLPRDRDEFVGRAADLAQLADFEDGGTPLVTVVGPGGTGKTRLALRFARSWLGEFPGGAWFCDLAGARDLDDVLRAVASALEVPLSPRDPLAQLGAAIAGRGRCVILLDNFEQVADVAAEGLNSWVHAAAEARFLATSREPLRLPGERVVSLGPLPEADAIALFALRARAQRSSFELADDNREDVQAIVRSLDGLPLAIELAAARSFEFSPAQLRAQLRERFELLGGARGVAARQATLRATIDWSWDALADWEKSALAQCSAFVGAFSTEAAEQVLDLAIWPEALSVADLLQVLTERSLLQAGPGRHAREPASHRLLVSVKEYASEKLRSPDAFPGSGPKAEQDCWQRHGKYHAGFGTEEVMVALCGPGGIEVERALASETDNFLEACRRAVDAGDSKTAVACLRAVRPSIERRGPVSIGCDLVERILFMESLDVGDRALLMLYRGDWSRVRGDLEGARASYEGAGILAKERGDRRLEGAALSGLGFIQLQTGGLDEAAGLLEAAIAVHGEVGNRRLEAITLDHLAGVRFHQGRPEDSLAICERALEIDREIGHRQHEACVLGHEAPSLQLLGRADEARRCTEEALAMNRESGDRRFEGNHLYDLGMLCAETGRPDEAREHFEAALVIHREVGNRPFEGNALGALAANHAEQGRLDEAREHYEAGLAIARETRDPRQEGQIKQGLAELLLAEGRLPEALALLDEALELHRRTGDKWHEACDLVCLGDLHLEAGRPGEAKPALEAALAIATRVGSGALVGIVLGQLGRLATAEGRYDEALGNFDRARDLLTAVNDVFRLGRLACARADCESRAGRLDSARAALQEAQAHHERLGAGSASRLGRELTAALGLADGDLAAVPRPESTGG